MRIFLFLFYNFSKLLIKISFGIYYKRRAFINRKGLRFDHPGIVLSNHPSTITDPLHVAARVKKMVFFIVNAGLFKSKIGAWFFGTFYCIPIERPEDVDGRPIRNNAAFAKADKFLLEGGCLFMAPQGYSRPLRKVGKLKSGAARIALSAENNANFQLGMKIIPVGLNYRNPYKFRNDILIHVGEPIVVSDYKKEYEENQFSAARKITADLADRYSELIIDVEDQEQDDLLSKTEIILENDHQLGVKETYLRTRKMLDHLKILKSNKPTSYNNLQNKVEQYFEQLENLKTEDLSIANNDSTWLTTLIVLILGFPFFIYGWVNNILANWLPNLLFKKSGLNIVYAGTVKILSGTFLIYPLIYGLQILLVHQLLNNWIATIIYTVTLAPLGLLTWKYINVGSSFLKKWKWKSWKKNKETQAAEIINQRASILTALKDLLDHAPKRIA